MPEWAKLTKEEKELYAHQMEVYAAYLSYVDHYIGELIAFLEEMGQLDNTLIIWFPTTAPAPKAARHGSFNENLFFNGVPDTVQQNLKHMQQLGQSDDLSALFVGLGLGDQHAVPPLETGSGPWRRLRSVHRSLAQGLQVQGRHSPAVHPRHRPGADRAGRAEDEDARRPSTAWPKRQIQGVSFAATFDNAKAKVPREAQYFEMFGQRAIYLDGWRAYAPWKFGEKLTAKDLDNDKWMLFNIDKDFSEANDIAAEYPGKLVELKQLWWAMANKYKVLPLDGRRPRTLRDAPAADVRTARPSTSTIRAPAKWRQPTLPTCAIAASASPPRLTSRRRRRGGLAGPGRQFWWHQLLRQ